MKSRGVNVRIVQNLPSKEFPDMDTKELMDMGAAEVRNISFDKLIGKGIIHTKLWVIDGKHFYVGSANMDWRSLTQVHRISASLYPIIQLNLSPVRGSGRFTSIQFW